MNYNSVQDRYAEREALPPIDPRQNWFLVRGMEDGGYTILEFTRNWTTCDGRDRDIVVRMKIFRYTAKSKLLAIGYYSCMTVLTTQIS